MIHTDSVDMTQFRELGTSEFPQIPCCRFEYLPWISWLCPLALQNPITFVYYVHNTLSIYLIDILPKVLTYAQDEWKHIFALEIVSKHEFHGFAKAVHTNPINYLDICTWRMIVLPLKKICWPQTIFTYC